MKTITEKEMLEQFQGVDTQRRIDLNEVVIETQEFMIIDANDLNEDAFLMRYYWVDTVEEMRKAHYRRLEVAEQAQMIALRLKDILDKQEVGILNEQQLQEIHNISTILTKGHAELEQTLQQLINDSFVPETKDERIALLRKQSEEAKDLTLAELEVHTYTYDVIKTMRDTIKSDNKEDIEKYLKSSNKLLREEAIRKADLCYDQMGVRMDDYEETKRLQQVIILFNQIDYKLTRDEKPDTNPFANIDFDAENPFAE